MNSLSQYYTSDAISALMVSCFSNKKPKHVIDIGVGDGSLLNSALDRWKNSNFTAIDIDPYKVHHIRKTFPRVNTIEMNALNPNLPELININKSTIDIAVCNPPYKRIDSSLFDYSLFEKAQMHNSLDLKIISTDVLFIAQNLLMLKNGGELGIILSDSIVTGHDFEAVRKDLIYGHYISKIIELPEKCFLKTEAKTYILVIKKNIKFKKEIKLYKADENGNLSASLLINHNSLVRRMDYSFHFFNHLNKFYGHTLQEVGADIRRGTRTKKELENLNDCYFHTTHFKKYPQKTVFFKHNSQNINQGNYCQPGDILIARNGKRVVGKVCIVRKGIRLISDCVLRVRVTGQYRQKLFNALKSENGQLWLRYNSHGVCSKVISKKDLLNFKF